MKSGKHRYIQNFGKDKPIIQNLIAFVHLNSLETTVIFLGTFAIFTIEVLIIQYLYIKQRE
jgi:hypothetical protein